MSRSSACRKMGGQHWSIQLRGFFRIATSAEGPGTNDAPYGVGSESPFFSKPAPFLLNLRAKEGGSGLICDVPASSSRGNQRPQLKTRQKQPRLLTEQPTEWLVGRHTCLILRRRTNARRRAFRIMTGVFNRLIDTRCTLPLGPLLVHVLRITIAFQRT